MKAGRTLTWRNNSNDQLCHPRRIEHPTTTEQLVELVQEAEREGTTVRAVGAGHAWSDVALTDGYLIETDAMSGLLQLDDGTLKPGVGEDPSLVRVRSGTRVRTLNALLEERGLGLVNMGGYDAQSIAGVVSTSTHGSGVTFGPFPDVVRSLDLVAARGERVRVEPEGGPTDPDAFAARHSGTQTLVQNDELFGAAVCGMGCLGVIDSLVLEVRPRYWLRERRVVRTWEEVRDDLAGGVLDRHDHYELFLNPYPRKDGRHELLVTTRDEVPEPAVGSPGDGERHPLIEIQASLPLVWAGLRLAARVAPSLMRTQFGRTLRRMEDENYTQVSYRVYNIGASNKLPAYSSELGVPAEGDTHLRTVDRILEIAADCADRRRLFHSSPIALRFVGPSRASASMMHGRPTMMIELILVSGTRGGRTLLAEYERRLAEFGARPHWGQYNRLDADPERLAALYPRWDAWLRAHARFNATGVFDSEFTDRIGTSVTQSAPAPLDRKYLARVRKGLDAALEGSKDEPFDPTQDRIVILSDHHKGAGDAADDFRRCEHAYTAALGYYLEAGYRLFVLGDAEELWEEDAEAVIERYRHVLELEAEFGRRGNGLRRFYGNHDDRWASQDEVSEHLHDVFGEISVREAVRLQVARPGRPAGTLFVVHGHQGTSDADRSGLARLVVRHVWRPLQRRTGYSATTPARDHALRAKHDRAMYEWARGHAPGLVLIAGHTHRPVFGRCVPDPPPTRPMAELAEALERAVAAGDKATAAAVRAELEYARTSVRRPEEVLRVSPPCYFNTGCCSFPDGDITGIELADGEIRLVRWPGNLHEMQAPEGGLDPRKRILETEDLERVLASVAEEPPAAPSVVEQKITSA